MGTKTMRSAGQYGCDPLGGQPVGGTSTGSIEVTYQAEITTATTTCVDRGGGFVIVGNFPGDVAAFREEFRTDDLAPTCTALATSGHVTGGGWINQPPSSDLVSFGFNVRSDGKAAKGTCNVIDHATGTHIKCVTVNMFAATSSHATFSGQATVDGVTTNYRIDVDDFGEPGTGDTFKISTGSGYTAAGTLAGGNIEIHRQPT